MSSLEVTPVRTSEEMAHALRIRTRVFVEEQRVPLDLEVDAFDGDPTTHARAGVVHVLARLDGVPVGTARMLLDAPEGHGATLAHDHFAHIGRVAVLLEHRRRSVGAVLTRALHEDARRRGFAGIAISAQAHAEAFYAGLGYVAHGPLYLEAGIEHRAMELRFG